ncbi:Arrestin domain-containing protein 3 [Orchesella cincta]|uniref:Arrestin domain-containing protein 3 n=1 Tax=Orchesella cincta TaxID=48709 RepID=A0A1D2NB23_ORCCI|nr:Arrestin domain-containing protein 3 [Orchesella cincta]
MPLDQFAILLDNPSMSYFPGQMVSGRVVIRANSEKNTQGLKLKFEGKASVHWSEEKTERTGSGNDATDRKVTKNFDDSDNFFDFKNYLLGDGRSDVKIPPGESSYPFSFQLPLMNLPSSYVGQHGKVEYLLEANVKRSWKFDYNAKQFITVNSIVDLNNDPQAAESGDWKTSKTFCCLCCASGPLDMHVRLKNKGFVPGEIIGLEVEINNLSTRGINDISTQLVQEATFFAQSSKNQSFKPIIDMKRSQGVDPGDSDIWRAELLVPPVPPTKLGGCRIIDVQYVLKVEAHVSGVAFNLKHSCPIVIGTVPLRARFEELKGTETVIPTAPPMFTPSGYPDLPQPRYQDSYNFKLDPPKPDNIVDTVTNTVIDNIVPSEPDYVPQYVTYGWKFNIPAELD